MIRCDLKCGCTAFALPREARQVAHRYWFCYAHGRYEAIVRAEPLTRGPASARRKRLRRPSSTRSFIE